jgi:hypothetical protein
VSGQRLVAESWLCLNVLQVQVSAYWVSSEGGSADSSQIV